ncbi:uncharacterized protein METZ01_LOCUS34776 [marine metagenome]|jgi:hypothetical protein|uniref:Uncharacterized protein n=1 Tax=marine metagenome TaxID=408172 RepID=A0A381QRA7_9ZZZZ|tara:strand:+ start:360 stop:689 length:330 start_codon:yes stop_codon:yes gene_type:complete
MNLEKYLTALMLLVALIAAFAEVPYSSLALLVLGLGSGFVNSIDDIMERTAYLLVAIAAPAVSDNLDLIPAVGTYLNSIIDGIAIAAAGIWIASFSTALVSRVMPDSAS